MQLHELSWHSHRKAPGKERLQSHAKGGRARLRAGSRNGEEPGSAGVQAAASTGTGKNKLHFCVLCSTGITKPNLLHAVEELGMHGSSGNQKAAGVFGNPLT